MHLYKRDKHYIVEEERVRIVDEYTGRVMADRSWERGLHQMVEAKEGLEISGRQETLARISYQRFFRRYLKLAGMTGTAREVAGEVWAVYRLDTVRIPTNRPQRRKIHGDLIYPTSEAKWQAIADRVAQLHAAAAPSLSARDRWRIASTFPSCSTRQASGTACSTHDRTGLRPRSWRRRDSPAE